MEWLKHLLGQGAPEGTGWYKPLAIEKLLTTEALDKYYVHVSESLKHDMEFLRRPIARRRLTSNGLKLIAWLAVAAGVLLPSLWPLGGTSSETARSGTEWAYIALAVGGLLLLLDQIFNISNSWTRLMLAEFQIKKIWYVLDFEWAKRRPLVSGDNVATEASAMIDLLRTAIADAHVVMETQKQTWATELDAALTALRTRVDRDQAAVAVALKAKEEEDRMPKSGALNIAIDKPEDLAGDLSIYVDGKQAGDARPVSSNIGVSNLSPGLRNIEVRANRKVPSGASFVYSQAITITAGQAGTLVVKV